MPRNGAGTYTPPGGTAAVSLAVISSTAYNSLIADIGNEITNSLPTTGVKAMGASLPMGGFTIINLGTPVNPTDAATKAYVDADLTTVQSFTSASSGTYTTPAGCRAIWIRAVGAGGAGGGAVATGAGVGSVGSGGAGGGYCESFIPSPSATYAYTVGAAGVAVSGGDGGDGGDTTIAGITASGGGGGFRRTPATATFDVTSGGIGGAATGGNLINRGGDHGQAGLSAVSSGSMLPGNGGPSPAGIAGRFGTPAASNPGSAPGSGRGGGGSGAGNLASQSARAGGNGAVGGIYVMEFY